MRSAIHHSSVAVVKEHVGLVAWWTVGAPFVFRRIAGDELDIVDVLGRHIQTQYVTSGTNDPTLPSGEVPSERLRFVAAAGQVANYRSRGVEGEGLAGQRPVAQSYVVLYGILSRV